MDPKPLGTSAWRRESICGCLLLKEASTKSQSAPHRMLPRLKPTSLRSTIDLLRQLDEIMSCWTDHQLHVFDSALISAQYMPVIRRNDLLTCSVFARLTSRTTCQISKVTVHHCRSSSQFLLSTLCEPLCVETKLLAKYVLYGATWHVKRKHVYCTEPCVCNTHGIQYTATVTALNATRSESARARVPGSGDCAITIDEGATANTASKRHGDGSPIASQRLV